VNILNLRHMDFKVFFIHFTENTFMYYLSDNIDNYGILKEVNLPSNYDFLLIHFLVGQQHIMMVLYVQRHLEKGQNNSC
jgi:hypothetical protein